MSNRYLENAHEWIVSYCKGKSVLDVGAAGTTDYYLPNRKHIWLNYKILEAAESVYAIDINQEGIDYAKKFGITIHQQNCETINLDRQFDVIVFYEVVEHLNSPGLAFENLLKHLKPGGAMILTTPNPGYWADLFRMMFNHKARIFHDHVTIFHPKHIDHLSRRYGYCVDSVFYFQMPEYKTRWLLLKSKINRIIARIFPHLSGNYIAIIRK